jgi:hypothetical protein
MDSMRYNFSLSHSTGNNGDDLRYSNEGLLGMTAKNDQNVAPINPPLHLLKSNCHRIVNFLIYM